MHRKTLTNAVTGVESQNRNNIIQKNTYPQKTIQI